MEYIKAIRLFRKVSQEFSSSVTAQSAKYSLEIKRGDRSNFRNLQKVHDSPIAIEIVARVAEFAHKRSGNHNAPHTLSRSRTKGVIASELRAIDQMLRLRQHELEDILSMYATRMDEKTYEEAVQKKYHLNQW